VEPGEQAAALRVAEQKAGFAEGSAEELILPSPTLSPRERIQIYRGMYLLRMEEALEIDFPAVAWYLGEANFKKLVAEYVQSYPSQSYTLDHLGRLFSQFLVERNWRNEGDCLGDLATLEWALCVVAVAHDSDSVTLEDLSRVPEENFLELKFEPVPAISTLRFGYDVNSLFKAWSSGKEPVAPSPESINLVCWRHNLKVWRQELSETAFDFLNLLRDGHPLGTSLDRVQQTHEVSEEQLFSWFQNWLGEGFFRSFRV
jgi:hypothetical protein